MTKTKTVKEIYSIIKMKSIFKYRIKQMKDRRGYYSKKKSLMSALKIILLNRII